VIVHGFETKMLAGLDHEGLAMAIVGERVETDGKTVEVVRITITEAGRRAIEGRSKSRGRTQRAGGQPSALWAV
jgi:hypothetical protein